MVVQLVPERWRPPSNVDLRRRLVADRLADRVGHVAHASEAAARGVEQEETRTQQVVAAHAERLGALLPAESGLTEAVILAGLFVIGFIADWIVLGALVVHVGAKAGVPHALMLSFPFVLLVAEALFASRWRAARRDSMESDTLSWSSIGWGVLVVLPALAVTSVAVWMGFAGNEPNVVKQPTMIFAGLVALATHLSMVFGPDLLLTLEWLIPRSQVWWQGREARGASERERDARRVAAHAQSQVDRAWRAYHRAFERLAASPQHQPPNQPPQIGPFDQLTRDVVNRVMGFRAIALAGESSVDDRPADPPVRMAIAPSPEPPTDEPEDGEVRYLRTVLRARTSDLEGEVLP